MKLQSELAPHFVKRVESSGFQSCEIGGDLATADGKRPRDNTIKGQSLITSAHFTTMDGTYHEVALTIQHTDEWWAAVTVLSNQGGPTPTIIIKDDVDAALPELKKLIDDTFDRLLKR